MVEPNAAQYDEKARCILKAASRIFLAHGFSAATTDMIQREAKVSKATLYAYFPGKDALFSAVIAQECAVMRHALQSIVVAPGDIAKTLTELGQAYLNILLSPDALALYRVVVAEAPRFPHLARQFYLTGPRTTVSTVTELLTQAVQSGEIHIDTIGVEDAAGQFISLLRSEAQMECLLHPDSRPSAQQQDRWVTHAVLTFLKAFMPQTRQRFSV